MLDRFDWGNDWSAFGVALFIGILVAAAAALLAFPRGVDLHSSPAWQVGVHHLMLALFLSLTFVLASRRPFCFGEGFRRGMLVLAILMPVAVFVVGWVLGGAYTGLRDERIFDLAVVSAASFVLLWATIVGPYTAFVFSQALVRYWRHGELPLWEGE